MKIFYSRILLDRISEEFKDNDWFEYPLFPSSSSSSSFKSILTLLLSIYCEE